MRFKDGLQYHCKTCHSKLARNWAANGRSTTRKTPEESSWGVIYNQYKNGAKYRMLPFDLSISGLIAMASQPCTYCLASPISKNRYASRSNTANHAYGRPLRFPGELATHPGVIFANGIDRIDSTKGYIAGNVVPCCETCNVMKLDATATAFLLQVSKITLVQALSHIREGRDEDSYE